MKKFVPILLSLGLALFIADAAISLLDDSLILFFGLQAVTAPRAMLGLLTLGAALVIYVLMGVTPLIPKRFFLPLTLFIPAVMLGIIPISIYHYDRILQVTWLCSFLQVLLCFGMLRWIQGGFKFRWPVISEEQLGQKVFGWLNLLGFVLVNLFLLAPAVLLYLFFCASLAVERFSGNFLALRSEGLSVQAQRFDRPDGKTIRLIPMVHIGESSFYDAIAKSFPTNSVILMEGVSDRKNLLKHKLSYKRVAESVGLTEQQKVFEPAQERTRPADVDVEQFSEESIEFLNLVTLLYSGGLNLDVLLQLIEKSQSPRLAKQLWEDLLTKRNEHLLKEIQAALLDSDAVVVPWGAAHMRGLAEEIRKLGFTLAEAQEYNVAHSRTIWNRLRSGPP